LIWVCLDRCKITSATLPASIDYLFYTFQWHSQYMSEDSFHVRGYIHTLI